MGKKWKKKKKKIYEKVYIGNMKSMGKKKKTFKKPKIKPYSY